MPVRPISNSLQLKAKLELNEDPERIEEDLMQIKEWLSKQPHIKARTDDQWLISFLRGCKYSLQRTKQKLDLFYTIRSMTPEFFSNRDPYLPEIQEVLKKGIIVILPKISDPAAPRVAIFCSKNAHLELDVYTFTKTLFMMLDIACLEDDNCVIAGKAAIVDLDGISYKHIRQFTPTYLMKTLHCLQTVYPTRIKGMHFMNAPSSFESISVLIRMCLTEKIKERVHFYSNMEDICKTYPLSIFPKDYGGEGPTCKEITADWKLKVESYRDWFTEDAQYYSDESRRPGKPKTTADVFGVEGSFRKLEID